MINIIKTGNKIEVRNDTIQEYLYNIIEKANRLYHILFLNSFSLNKVDDAEQYIKLHKEYDNIVDTLQALYIYNWLDVNLYDRNDIVIK